MSATWETFQSALELAAGANMALYAFPQLAQQEIDTEGRRWKSLIEDLRYSNPRAVVGARSDHVIFLDGVHRFDEIGIQIRRLALWAAAVSAAALLYASLYPKAEADRILLGVFAIGVAPALGLTITNLRARGNLELSKEKRLKLQAQVNDQP